MSDRIEQSSRLRDEPPATGSTIVVRGGRDSVEKLSTHVARAALWDYNGEPLHGISVFCALDAAGPASIDGVRWAMRTYREVYFAPVGAVAAAGHELLPTGKRPHFTLHDPTRRSTIDMQELLDLFGEPQRNPFFETGRTS